MALSEQKIREYSIRLMKSRLRLLCTNGFYGLLLMHLILTIDEECETAATDGIRLFFGPTFLENLSDEQLDVVMMHEVLHIALQHLSRKGDYESEKFDYATDIVVNSVILESLKGNVNKITLNEYGVLPHTTPDGKEGANFTAEEVYAMLPKFRSKNSVNAKGSKKKDDKGTPSKKKNGKGDGNGSGGSGKGFDSHDKWQNTADDNSLREQWMKHVVDAAQAMAERGDASDGAGLIPSFAQRLVDALKKPQTDWRSVIDFFVQEEICDYSFNPPDRRFGDSDFFLPDFNEKDETVKNILFMIDTSASMTQEMITAAYSEIKGAIEQFNGRLEGWLGFFDASVKKPVPFETVDDILSIPPLGGGGTRFDIIFEHVNEYMSDNPPSGIIILTDGKAAYPDEEITNGIPVLWLINNEKVTPPWGKIARIEV